MPSPRRPSAPVPCYRRRIGPVEDASPLPGYGVAIGTYVSFTATRRISSVTGITAT